MIIFLKKDAPVRKSETESRRTRVTHTLIERTNFVAVFVGWAFFIIFYLTDEGGRESETQL